MIPRYPIGTRHQAITRHYDRIEIKWLTFNPNYMFNTEVLKSIQIIENPQINKEAGNDKLTISGTVLDGKEAILTLSVDNDSAYWMLKGNKPSIRAQFKVDGVRMFWNVRIDDHEYKEFSNAFQLVEDKIEEDKKNKIGKLYDQLGL